MSHKLEQMNLHDMVHRLIGRVDPVGETNEDANRLENLETMILLVDKLTFDLGQVCRENGAHMASIKKAVNRSREFLRELREALGDEDLEEIA